LKKPRAAAPGPRTSGFLKAKDKDDIWPGLRIPPHTSPILPTHANGDSEKVGGSNAENSAFHVHRFEARRDPGRAADLCQRQPRFRVRQNDKLPSSSPQLCVNWLRSLELLKPHSQE
jgi:hypothetical protein